MVFAFYQQEKKPLNLFTSLWGYVASFLGVRAGLVIISASTEEASLLDKLSAGISRSKVPVVSLLDKKELSPGSVSWNHTTSW